jgi:hypothetical protein
MEILRKKRELNGLYVFSVFLKESRNVDLLTLLRGRLINFQAIIPQKKRKHIG